MLGLIETGCAYGKRPQWSGQAPQSGRIPVQRWQSAVRTVSPYIVELRLMPSREDIPLGSLHTQFNCNFSIVSQTNPHIHLFFFAPRGSVGRPVANRKGKGAKRVSPSRPTTDLVRLAWGLHPLCARVVHQAGPLEALQGESAHRQHKKTGSYDPGYS